MLLLIQKKKKKLYIFKGIDKAIQRKEERGSKNLKKTKEQVGEREKIHLDTHIKQKREIESNFKGIKQCCLLKKDFRKCFRVKEIKVFN